ncbi:MAG: hypothetical protein CVT73_10525 [Alphaproteobacteria bacterium HGW-Alphaproteobacteria-12]|nr:MAG: hypothetical protein CVT73_10525 [Alphaproteobacteria bacterium HGW-Alphaproteobacteria-12]
MASERTVTIGVPVYNGAGTLRTSLECLQNQTYRDIEVIVSDNASTDDSADIAQEFVDKDSRFHLVRRETNIGPAPNFFSLLERAQTELFMWRADDDWSEPDYVEKLVALFDKDEHTKLAAAESVFVRPNGVVAAVKSFSAPHQKSRVSRIGHMLMNLNPNSICGLWDRRTLIEIMTRTKESYPYVWAWDHVVLLPVILAEGVSGTNETRLYVGQPEARRYSVKERAETMWKMRRVFRHACFAELRRIHWRWWEKPVLTLIVLRYANLRVYRFWKTVRRHIRQFFELADRKPPTQVG